MNLSSSTTYPFRNRHASAAITAATPSTAQTQSQTGLACARLVDGAGAGVPRGGGRFSSAFSAGTLSAFAGDGGRAGAGTAFTVSTRCAGGGVGGLGAATGSAARPTDFLSAAIASCSVAYR